MSTSLSSSAVAGRGQGRGGGEGGRGGVRGDKEERWTPLATIARPPPARRPPASASGEAWQASDRTRVTVAAGATLNGPSVGSRARPEPSFTQFNNVPATAQSPRRDRHDELLQSDSHRTAVVKPGDTATAVKASQDTNSSSKSNGVSIVKNGTSNGTISNGSAGGYGKRKPASQHAQCPCLLEGNIVCKCTLPFSFNSSSDSTSTPSAVVSSPASDLSGSPSVLRQRKVRFESNISVRTTRENWWDSCGDRGLGLLMSKKMASTDNDVAATGNAEATAAAAAVPMEGGNLLPRKNSNESVYVNQSYVGDIAVDDTPEWDHEQFQDTTPRQNVTRVATDEEMLIAATLSRLGITPAGPRLQPPSPSSPSPNGTVIKKSALKSSASPRRGVSFVDQASYQTGTVFKCPVKELSRAAKRNEIQLLEQLKDTKLTQTEYEMAVRQVLRSGKVCYYGPCYRRWVQTLLLASLFLLVWSGGCVAWLSTGVSIRYGAVVCFLIATTVLIFGMLVFTLVRKQFDKKSSRLLRNVNEQLSSSGILCSLATDSDGGYLNVLFMAIDVEKCLSTVADDLKRESEPAVCNGASGSCAENNEKTAAQRQELARSIAFGCAASYVSCVSERRLTVRERGGGEYRHLVGTLCLCQYVEKFALNVSGHQDVFS